MALTEPPPKSPAPQATPASKNTNEATPKSPRKRKSDAADGEPKSKRPRTKTAKAETTAGASSPSKPQKVTLKLGPKPQESDVFPCCLCVSTSQQGLLRVHNPPVWQKEGQSGEGSSAASEWRAHEDCANVIPETWVDDMNTEGAKEKMVFGTDAIPRDRWNLVRNAAPSAREIGTLINEYLDRNATLARRLGTKRTAHRSSARKANVPKRITFLARKMAKRLAFRTRCSEKSKTMSFSLTRRIRRPGRIQAWIWMWRIHRRCYRSSKSSKCNCCALSTTPYAISPLSVTSCSS